MRPLPMLTLALAVLAAPAFGQEDDPIAVREALMHNNGAAAAVAGGMMKGEIPYSPVAASAVFNAWNATAATFGDYVPEGSADPERSRAAPAIWEDMAGFEAALSEFQTAVDGALQAAGENGPADVQAFTAAAQPVLQTCMGCHEDYRLPEEE